MCARCVYVVQCLTLDSNMRGITVYKMVNDTFICYTPKRKQTHTHTHSFRAHVFVCVCDCVRLCVCLNLPTWARRYAALYLRTRKQYCDCHFVYIVYVCVYICGCWTRLQGFCVCVCFASFFVIVFHFSLHLTAIVCDVCSGTQVVIRYMSMCVLSTCEYCLNATGAQSREPRRMCYAS